MINAYTIKADMKWYYSSGTVELKDFQLKDYNDTCLIIMAENEEDAILIAFHKVAYDLSQSGNVTGIYAVHRDKIEKQIEIYYISRGIAILELTAENIRVSKS